MFRWVFLHIITVSIATMEKGSSAASSQLPDAPSFRRLLPKGWETANAKVPGSHQSQMGATGKMWIRYRNFGVLVSEAGNQVTDRLILY
jgi:hypothetical protein